MNLRETLFGPCGRTAIVAVWLISSVGCSGSGLATVQGDVTFDGKIIEAGVIAFEPVDGAGATTGGKIEHGKYHLAGSSAVPPGEKTVRITASRKTGRQVPAGRLFPQGTLFDEVQSYIPASYNGQSTLRCQVVAGETNQHDFHLKSP